MKRWKVTFGLFLLLFALATTVACAETKEAKMDWNDRTVIFAQPGETIHFTYLMMFRKASLWIKRDGHGVLPIRMVVAVLTMMANTVIATRKAIPMSQREPMSNLMEKVALLFPTMKWFV